LWLKLISRTPRTNKKHGLEIEDALWWTDWVVAACFALVGSLIAAARDNKDIPVPQVVVATLALFVGFSVMPFGLRMIAYEPDAKIRGWIWVWAANGVASLVLLSAVAAGVKVYG
jgi:xanthine/uracil permease